MTREGSEPVAAILESVTQGGEVASERLTPLLHAELRAIAARLMRQEKRGFSLHPTALVHESWLRLFGGREARFENRAHFFAAAAEAMRRILIEAARRRRRLKRGGGFDRITLDGLGNATPGQAGPSLDLLALDDALARLEARDPRLARIVTCRYFAGLSVEETATALEVSAATVKRDWQFAKAWLKNELGPAA